MSRKLFLKPTFFQGVLTAVILSGVGGMLSFLLSYSANDEWALRSITSLVSCAYIFYLLSFSKKRVGKISAVLVLIVSLFLVWYFQISLINFAVSHVFLICLIRSFYYHANILGFLIDLMLGASGVVAAIWAAEQSASLFLVLWCFFLVQALFVYIPRHWQRSSSVDEPLTDDRFQRAFQSANTALDRLSSNKL